MPDLAVYTRTVRDHIRATPGVTANFLTIDTEPGTDSAAVTTVRRSVTGAEWTDAYAERLFRTLKDMPGAARSATLARIRDRIVIVWEA
jgi:hypothetical protein